MSHILVDMDGVLVDWGASYDMNLDAFGHMSLDIPRHEQQTSFNLYENMDEHQVGVINAVMSLLDYGSMKPIPGGAEALEGMLDFGHEVMLCTSPWLGNPTCISGKFKWVEKHLGAKWVDKVILTRDKTVVNGSWLIDDKPDIHGYQANPAWTQIIFDQPYNRDITSQPRLKSWADWDNRRFN